jgi:hypothetical protein
MGRLGGNSFRRDDAVRAIESSRDAGIAPAMVEVVVAKDGSVIYCVYGEDAVPASASSELGEQGMPRRDRQAAEAVRCANGSPRQQSHTRSSRLSTAFAAGGTRGAISRHGDEDILAVSR